MDNGTPHVVEPRQKEDIQVLAEERDSQDSRRRVAQAQQDPSAEQRLRASVRFPRVRLRVAGPKETELGSEGHVPQHIAVGGAEEGADSRPRHCWMVSRVATKLTPTLKTEPGLFVRLFIIFSRLQ